MKTFFSRWLSFSLSCSALFCIHSASAQGDDFDDGDSAGWSEVTPLSVVGVTTTFSFPEGNRYRMQSQPSPNEGTYGPARMGAVREDVSYTDFYQFVDVTDYDQSLDQSIGMLARVKEIGLGTLDGYGVTYNPAEQKMFFTVITDEDGNTLDDVDVPVTPGDPVRLVFQGSGDVLKVEIFALPNLETPVASIEVSDSTWTSGVSGIFVVTDVADPALAVDCTFDNYFAAAAKPIGFSLIEMQIEGDMLVFDFFSVPGQSYAIWRSDGRLDVWEEDTDSICGALADRTRFRIQKPEVARRYYQIRLQ